MLDRALLRPLGIAAAKWAVVVVLLVAWWVLLAPVEFGGRTLLVDVAGRSMQPGLFAGDLVVARVEPSYSVGDVVVFHVHDAHVIHRIVGGSADLGWLTQGDNNPAADPWLVRHGDVAGRMVLGLPGLGVPFRWLLMNPFVAASIIAALPLLPTLSFPRLRRRVPSALASRAHRLGLDVRVLRGLGAFVQVEARLAAYLIILHALVTQSWSYVTWLSAAGTLIVGGVLKRGLRRLAVGGNSIAPAPPLRPASADVASGNSARLEQFSAENTGRLALVPPVDVAGLRQLGVATHGDRCLLQAA